MSSIVKWSLFGTYTLEYNHQILTEKELHSKKLIQLLTYLLLNRDTQLSQQQLIEIFCVPGTKGPADTLKNLIYRLRMALKPFGEQEFICTTPGGYAWNPEVKVQSDYERFMRLATESQNADTVREKKELCREALGCFRDDFSRKLVCEPWFALIAQRCREQRIEIVKMLCQSEEVEGRWGVVEEVCHKAFEFDAFNEDVHCELIRSLCAQKRYEDALHQYEVARRMLYEATGIQDMPKLRSAYTAIISEVGKYIRGIGTVLMEAAEAEKPHGAYLCGYDTFRHIYQMEARKSARSNLPEGMAEHILLLTVVQTLSLEEQELDDGQLEDTMGILGRTIQNSLRMGDVYSKCSPSQFIVLLGTCTLANGEMIADRIRKAFLRNIQKRPYQLAYELDSLKTYEFQQRLLGNEDETSF